MLIYFLFVNIGFRVFVIMVCEIVFFKGKSGGVKKFVLEKKILEWCIIDFFMVL